MSQQRRQQQMDETFDLVFRINPLLAGREPSVQGAVLADLVARWLAGQDESNREAQLERWLVMARGRVKQVIAEAEPPPSGSAH
jgi:hypothetical protein